MCRPEYTKIADGLLKKRRRRPDRVWPSCAKVREVSCHQRQGAECSHVKARAFRAQSYGGKRILSKGLDALYEGRRAGNSGGPGPNWPDRGYSRLDFRTTSAPSRLCTPSRSILEAGKNRLLRRLLHLVGNGPAAFDDEAGSLVVVELAPRVCLASAAPAKIPSVRPLRSSA